MFKFVAPLAAAAFAFAVGAANAEETSGAITHIDKSAKEITLDNGMKFSLSSGLPAELLQQLKEGASVKVTYDRQGEKMVATQVSADSSE